MAYVDKNTLEQIINVLNPYYLKSKKFSLDSKEVQTLESKEVQTLESKENLFEDLKEEDLKEIKNKILGNFKFIESDEDVEEFLKSIEESKKIINDKFDVLEKNYNDFEYKETEIFEIPINEDGDYDKTNSGLFEILRPIRDITTEFNLQSIFMGKLKLFFIIGYLNVERMLDLIRKKYNLSEEQLLIYFKGGINLRFLFINSINEFNNQQENYLINLLNKVMKLSDFDYQIKLSTKIENFEKVHNVVNNSIYLLNYFSLPILSKLLNLPSKKNFENLSKNIGKKFNELKIVEKKNLLKNKDLPTFYNNYDYVGIMFNNNKVGNLNPFEFKINNKKFTDGYRNSFLVLSKNKLEEKTMGNVDKTISSAQLVNAEIFLEKIGLKDKKHIKNYSLYNSISIPKFARISEDITIFSLNRIKLNYVLFLKNKKTNEKEAFYVPGEIFDYSSPAKDDYKEKIFNPKLLEKYQFINLKYQLIGMNYEAFIDDIKLVLYNETLNNPWIDMKYEKRLKRLFFAIFFKMFNHIPTKELIINLKNIKKNLLEKNSLYKNDFYVNLGLFNEEIFDNINDSLTKETSEKEEYKQYIIKYADEFLIILISFYIQRQKIKLDTEKINTIHSYYFDF